MKETVVAISTPPGRGGIGIVRMSGKDSLKIVNKVFKGKDLIPRYMTYGHILDEKNIVDEVMVCYYQALKSYTKEDMVEIFCHGGYVSCVMVLDILLKNGAVLAEGGEFTKRAFFNGRINLLEAEAIKGIIDSESKTEQQLYQRIYSGKLSEKIDYLMDEMISLVAECEAKIDYPELGDVEDFKERINIISERIDSLISDANRSKLYQEGIKTAILGRPNVGKSSLLNMLTNKERAIVTEIPGTTRDTIEERIFYRDISLNLVDTAGIRNTDELVEKIGIDISKKTAEISDLIILMIDASEELSEDDLLLLSSYNDKKKIVFLNKLDKTQKVSEEDIKKYGVDVIAGSVKNDIGIRELLEKIYDMLKTNLDSEFVSLFNIRQINLLEEAKEELAKAKSDMDYMPFEVVEVSLRVALDKVLEIIGRVGDDEIIDRVFKDFCVGK